MNTILGGKDGDTDVVSGLQEEQRIEFTVGGFSFPDSAVMSNDDPPTFHIENSGEDIFATLDEGPYPPCNSETNSDLINFSDVELYETNDEVKNQDIYLQPGGHSGSLDNFQNHDMNGINNNKENLFQQRNTWLRSSLRRSTRSHKRPSSNASARMLFRSSSPINGHNADYDSDLSQDQISLEDDVQTLNEKIHNLQKQVLELQDGQSDNDDRYEKVKQENVNLMTRIHLLEEQIREHEIRTEEKSKEEQKRLKELMTRHEREKSQEIEDYANKIHILQKENQNVLEEVSFLKNQIEKLKLDKLQIQEKLELNMVELSSLKQEKKTLEDAIAQERRNFMEEKEKNKELIEQLKQKSEELKDYEDDMKCLERFRSHSMQELPNQFFELQKELKQLKEENKKLIETNEELQAYLSNSSIIQELPQSSPLPLEDELETLSKEQLRKLLQEQEEDNTKLRKYIDGILLNIVENYPELLEVKPIL